MGVEVQGKMKLSKILFESDVYRLDSDKIKSFGSSLRTYHHSPDWMESGLAGEHEEVPEGMMKSKVLFAVGDKRDVVPYMAPRDASRIWTDDTLYFNKSDERAVRSHKAWLSVFDGDDFRYLEDSNEYVSSNPKEPTKQDQITDAVGFMEQNGYKVEFVDDVVEKAEEFDETGVEYNAEGL
jgi:hypothetical protein